MVDDNPQFVPPAVADVGLQAQERSRAIAFARAILSNPQQQSEEVFIVCKQFLRALGLS